MQVELLPDRGVDLLVEPLPGVVGDLERAEDVGVVAALGVEDAGEPRLHRIVEVDVAHGGSFQNSAGAGMFAARSIRLPARYWIAVWLWLPTMITSSPTTRAQ